MVPGKGYIHNGYVWVFRNDIKSTTYPIVYHEKGADNDELMFIEPPM